MAGAVGWRVRGRAGGFGPLYQGAAALLVLLFDPPLYLNISGLSKTSAAFAS
jgi:hypothetical protein